MKQNRFTKYISIILLCLFFISCDKVLDDVENLRAYEPTKVWTNEILANAYLTNLYAETMPSWPINGNYVDETGPDIVQAEMVTSQNNSFKPWSYSTIRKINILLSDIKTGTLKSDFKNNIIGQTYFLRAFLYFKMLKNYGGIPIIKVAQKLDDDLKVKRSSSLDCFKFIIEDLDLAFSLVPDRNTGDNFGRIDKAVILAFKARVLLRKASPQFNPTNQYDNKYWEEAYIANKEAKDKLSLFGFKLLDDYSDIFKIHANNEAILATIYINPGKTNGRQEHGVRPLSESKDATGYDQPIWSLVKAYTLLDGKKIGESTKYSYDEQKYWKNRDPRFEKSISYNAAIWELGGKSDRRQYNTYDLVAYGLADASDIFGDKQLYGRTGFYCKKGIEANLVQNEVGNNSTDWIELRYAEVLLNFAETANETGRANEAMEILKKIRKRAGIESGASNLYGFNAVMTKEDIRKAIQNERRVEFAFEGKRLSDLRRNRQWELLDGNKKYGIESNLKLEFINDKGQLIKDANGNYTNATGTISRQLFFPEDFTYIVTECKNTIKEMVIPTTYYFFPIRKSDIEKNINLEQTQGWDNGKFVPTL